MPDIKSEEYDGRYVLETGRKGEVRLNLLHQVYGEETEKLLLGIGLKSGMNVADIGCGPGNVTLFMASRVGPEGISFGIDGNADQLSVAREEARRKELHNVRFVEANVYSMGIESDSFDLVYARSLLSHLKNPQEAVIEMKRIVRPGGVLVCEDIDMLTIRSEPQTPEYELSVGLWTALMDYIGADASTGAHMAGFFRNAGFADVHETFHQPEFNEGERKRYWEYTLYEVVPSLLKDGLITTERLEVLASGLKRIGLDKSIAVAQAVQFQVWAWK